MKKCTNVKNELFALTDCIKTRDMENVKIFDEKKFMWDGRPYISESEASAIKAEYEKNNFETCIIQEEGQFFLFTRRVVTEVEVEK